MPIHHTAIVDPGAELAEDVDVRPYSIIGPQVKIDSGTIVGPHAVIDGDCQIGKNCVIYPFASVGHAPQDITYAGEHTKVIIGDNNIIREGVTIHRGTKKGGGLTKLGNNNLIMAYVHIAHDCILGNNIIMANVATLAGHVIIDDFAVVGGLVAVHQFVRIGTHAYIGGKTGINKDIPPYMLASGPKAKLFGPNVIGLRRKNFSEETIDALRRSFKIIFRSNLTLSEAFEKIEKEIPPTPEVKILVEFIQNSSRGITR
ncbi:MAG: acyl-[acyl-carrier-protein]--UDP-N-acetylglucosamine O-acyltransferase [Deltaproteobacteria bacterium]|nr:MAG: acyl-[acyl-carrier-protein]--UDP-N-acetylglucosamine O-acyltransferase [Deltaproteobacteria bacterium]